MIIQLTKAMAIDMLKGTEPNWGKMDMFEKLKYGYYTDLRGWEWFNIDKLLEDIEIEKILEYYNICKESWNG